MVARELLLPYSRTIPGLVSVRGLSMLFEVHTIIPLFLHANSGKIPEIRLQNFPPNHFSLTIS